MDEIREVEEEHFKDIHNLKESCFKMAWYMRGSVSVTEIMTMSYEEREILNDIIKENLETTKKSGLPFF